MDDHNNCYLKRSENEENMCENRIINTMTSREEDSLLEWILLKVIRIFIIKNQEILKILLDIIRKNNSWKEIGDILNTTASDCQTRWAKLRERYSREKKLREMETRSGSGSTMRQSFPLYEQMNFLFKFVKSRKSIINISNLTSKHPIKTNEATKILGSLNILRNQIRSNEDDTINKSSKPTLRTMNASSEIASTNLSTPSAFHSSSYSVTTFCSNNSDNSYSQKNMAKEPHKHNKLKRPFPINSEPANITNLCDSDDDFPSSPSPNASDFLLPPSPNALTTNDKIFPLLEYSETLSKNKEIFPTAHSRSLNRKISSQLDKETVFSASQLDRESVFPASQLDRELVLPFLDSSSSRMSLNSPKIHKKIKCTSSADRLEESFFKLTSVVSAHLEKKSENKSFDITDEDEIFAKAIACQLKKYRNLKNLN